MSSIPGAATSSSQHHLLQTVTQSNAAPQMTPAVHAAIQAAIGNREPNPPSLLLGRTDFVAPEVLLGIPQFGGASCHQNSLTHQSDRDTVFEAVTQNGLALEHASERLRNDFAIVLAAVTQNGLALEHASERLRNDFVIVLAAVTQNGLALEHASETLLNDFAIVRAAVTQNGLALEHASERLKADHDIVLAAVKNGLALENIPVDLRTIEIACEAVAQNPEAMRFVPQVLFNRANREIDTNPAFLPFVNPSLITHKISLEAVKLNPLLLRFVPLRILKERPLDGTEDDDIILLALKQNPEALHLIPWELLTGARLSFVIEMHKRDNKRSLILSLLKLARIMGEKPLEEIQIPHLDLAWPLLEFFNDVKEIMLILINKYGLEASDASPQIRFDPDITEADRQVLERTQADRQILERIWRNDPNFLGNAPSVLGNAPSFFNYS